MKDLMNLFSGVQSAFVGIREYTNSYGEISNQTVLIGSNRQKCKQRDLQKLKFALSPLGQRINPIEGIKREACEALIKSLEKPSKARSDAQKDAYTIVTDGVKVHNETGMIYIYGRSIAKRIITEGEYPTVNSRPLTIAKKELRKELKLESHRYRQFKIKNISQIAIVGQVLTAENGFEFGVAETVDAETIDVF